ncbi:MAG: V-type ATP synthase subunit A [Trueperaceae bacterium]|nr:MAG: V-type ATP synthase subunit A [Trueperaceae bacterium]
MPNIGRIVAVSGSLITVTFKRPVVQNEVGYAMIDDLMLKAELIRVRGEYADLQVFEDTSGLFVGGQVEFTGEMLSVELGPGLLGQVVDGLQNPLFELAETSGYFLPRGRYLDPLDRERRWPFTPSAQVGDALQAGEALGSVPEGQFQHRVMVPFGLPGAWTLRELAAAGEYTVSDVVARLENERGEQRQVTMLQRWPVKVPIRAYRERLRPQEPLVTKVRIVDTLFPVARGGTSCIPGPFGAGKTVLQQLMSRHAEVDVVVVAACGERAGEVVETLREFPELTDPRTGRSLMERTVIVCNTSSMPVAAREASVYTAVTLAEYYRQMGLDVLLLADSTSRWAQALREVSGRLEEIPGEEAFPAYLESVVAAFYERGGLVRLHDGTHGSVTIAGTVSPAGGNLEEPVTQATLKVVGAFHGLSRARSDARRYPAIDPLDSWSHYPGVVSKADIAFARSLLHDGHEVDQMMKVVGEEGTGIEDFVRYLQAEYLDAAYLQQDAFDPVDGATGAERQTEVFGELVQMLRTPVALVDKDAARRFYQHLTQVTKEWNRCAWDSPEYQAARERLRGLQSEVGADA